MSPIFCDTVNPIKLAIVKSIPILIIGKSIGNANTGKRAFLEFALAIIADITVVAVAIANEEMVMVMISKLSDLTTCAFKKRKKNVSAKKLINKLVMILNINFPK